MMIDVMMMVDSNSKTLCGLFSLTFAIFLFGDARKFPPPWPTSLIGRWGIPDLVEFFVISMLMMIMMTIMTMMTVAAMMKITRRTMMIPLATTQERAPLDLPNWWSCAGRQTETWGLSSSWSSWWRWGKQRSENRNDDDEDDYEDGYYEEKVGLVSVVIWCFCNWRREWCDSSIELKVEAPHYMNANESISDWPLFLTVDKLFFL